jgi:hypothetical protein
MAFLQQAIHALLQETLSPFGDGRSRGVQSFLNFRIAPALSQHENHPSAKHISCWQ